MNLKRRLARVMSVLAAAGLLALAAVAIVRYRADLERRKPLEAFAVRYSLQQRHEEDAHSLAKAPTFEFGAESVARAAVSDAAGGVDLSKVSSEVRTLWLDVVGELDTELATASTLLLDAIRFRPGWAYNHAYLGVAQYHLARRNAHLGEHPERWLTPFRVAIAAAPGDRWTAVWAGYAAIDSWPYLSGAQRESVVPLLREALQDPNYVADSFLPVIDAVGHDRAFAMLPNAAAPLYAAMKVEAEAAHTDAAAALFRRWERAEWQERVRDLNEVEERYRLDDRSGTLQQVRSWASRHHFFGFDTPAGRAQVARLLALWPSEPGEWGRDPRTRAVRYLLDRPLSDTERRAIGNTVNALSRMPPPERARALVVAGDSYGAEAIANAAGGGVGLEWTPYFVASIHDHLRNGRLTDARATLRRVAPMALDECDVAVARQAIEAAEGSSLPLPAQTAPVTYPAAAWAGQRLAVCVDPFAVARGLRVEFSAEADALVSFGFDDGRLATALFPAGNVTIRVPLDDGGGRRVFGYRTIAGGPVRALTATIGE